MQDTDIDLPSLLKEFVRWRGDILENWSILQNRLLEELN